MWNKKVFVAAIVFIMQSAIGYEVTEATLSNELQQVMNKFQRMQFYFMFNTRICTNF